MSKPVPASARAASHFQPRWIAMAAFLACAPVATTVFAQSETLPTVTVTGDADSEDARGAVNGYVAKRSVTATKTDVPIAETAQSISVVTREQLDVRAVQNVSDALSYTAGVVSAPYGHDPRYDWVLLRGFSGVSNLFRDGLALQSGTFALAKSDPYGLERIEVLRGPASVMYGKVGPGGLVNQVSKRPTDTPLREIGVTYGSHDKKQVMGDFSDKLNADGSVRYRLTGLVQDAETQIDFNKQEKVFLAPSLDVKINRDTDLTLLANYQRERNKGNTNGTYSPNLKNNIGALTFGFVTQVDDIPRNRNIGSPDFDGFDRDYASIGYQLEHRLGNDVTLRQNVRYEDLEIDYRRTQLSTLDIDFSTVPFSAQLVSNAIGVKEHVKALLADQHAEMRFGGNGVEHRVLVGLDFLDKRYDEAVATGAPTIVFNPINPVYQPVAYPALTQSADYKQRQIGLYLQDRIKIQERLILSGALRHDWVRSETNGILATPSSQQSDSSTSGSLAAMYLLGHGVSPYVSYSTSFDPLLGTDAVTGKAYKPQTARQYEAGVKVQPAGTNTMFTAAVFNLRQKNTLSRNTLILGDPATQSGETETQGLELEFGSTLFRGFNINGSYTYLDGEVLKHRTAALQGSRPDLVPRQTAGIFAEYTLQSGPAQGLAIGAGARYVGEQSIRDMQVAGAPGAGTYLDFKTPAYTVADASLRYTTGPWTLALNATNLFDKKAFAYCGVQSCSWNTAREVLFTARYRW